MNLVTLCGQQVTTLTHMLKHYRHLVDDIFVIVHRLSEHDQIEAEVRAITDKVGCGIYKSFVADRFDPVVATKLYNDAMSERPDEWWIVADPDEFHLYFDDIRTIVEECEAQRWSFVGGHFLDRFGPGGTLPELDDSEIWGQFPLAGVSRSVVTTAPGWKICLAKGTVELAPGQHFVVKKNGVVGYPIQRGLVQVHHFKWDSTVLARQLDTLATLKSEVDVVDESCRVSYQTMYDYLIANGGKVNLADPRGLFAECPDAAFSAYPYWPMIVRQAPPHGLEFEWGRVLARDSAVRKTAAPAP